MHASLPDSDRLTREEFEREVIALHAGQPAMPSKEQDLATRRRELELLVDYQLGRSFPASRREEMWRIHSELYRHRLATLVWGAIRNPLNPSNGVVRAQVRGYSRVLEPGELSAFLDLSPQEIDRCMPILSRISRVR